MKLNVWKRKGLYYEKTQQWVLGENVSTVTCKLFCITYWLLKSLHPGKY